MLTAANFLLGLMAGAREVEERGKEQEEDSGRQACPDVFAFWDHVHVILRVENGFHTTSFYQMHKTNSHVLKES